ncbi:MAG: alpha/beta hydrolase [Chloroflexota bacterium]
MTLHPTPPDPLVAFVPDTVLAPPPDPAAVPEGFLVASADGARIHFLDWGTPAGPGGVPGILLLPGFLAPAWSWAPVARRLAGLRHVVIADLRGHGLSDAPPSGYDTITMAADVAAVAEGSGLLDGGPVVLAGHGFGASLAVAAAARLGAACAAVVLVDGGWERTEETTGLDLDEFLRTLDEPPEVLRSMGAYLADRRAFDPPTWDADQERAARDAVVETAAGHVVRAVRQHVIAACARSMYAYDPAAALAAVAAPVVALVALASGDAAIRSDELRRSATARATAGRPAARVAVFPGDAHNLLRYRPADVAAAMLEPMAGS